MRRLANDSFRVAVGRRQVGWPRDSLEQSTHDRRGDGRDAFIVREAFAQRTDVERQAKAVIRRTPSNEPLFDQRLQQATHCRAVQANCIADLLARGATAFDRIQCTQGPGGRAPAHERSCISSP